MSKCTFIHNKNFDGIEIKFPGIPDESVRLLMKEGKRFRYHRKKKIWYGKYSPENWKFAEMLCATEGSVMKDVMLEEEQKAKPKKFTKVYKSISIKRNNITINIFKFRKVGTKREFFAGETEDGKRIGTTMFARRGEAEKEAKSYIDWKVKKENTPSPKTHLQTKIKAFQTALKYAPANKKSSLDQKIKAFQTALKYA